MQALARSAAAADECRQVGWRVRRGIAWWSAQAWLAADGPRGKRMVVSVLHECVYLLVL
jgi:hypothetical protein